jgi:hypothetical protein
MLARPTVMRLLAHEARALLTRLARVEPFVLHQTMVPAAAISPGALSAIERYLVGGRRELRTLIGRYLGWLTRGPGRIASPAEAQRQLVLLRLRFNIVLSQFDLFSAVLTQRSEHQTGVWLSGLDVFAADALHVPGGYYQPPPVICYLDRGPGAAIRRARTRLPGGGRNPVAIVRVPRERMVGSGLASSLVHEVGHQAAALLGLNVSLRPLLRGMARQGASAAWTWALWDRWISEIVADFWSVGRVGVGATLGLMSVVSLPRAFVFRLNVDDPHPFPWIRVKLSCALGEALFPHPQWQALATQWESLYPTTELSRSLGAAIQNLQATMPALVALIINHRPRALRGHSLGEVLAARERQPARLAALRAAWRHTPALLRGWSPTLAFAVLGQAKADGHVGPEEESALVGRLLTDWALHATIDTSSLCADLPRMSARSDNVSPTAAVAVGT